MSHVPAWYVLFTSHMANSTNHVNLPAPVHQSVAPFSPCTSDRCSVLPLQHTWQQEDIVDHPIENGELSLCVCARPSHVCVCV